MLQNLISPTKVSVLPSKTENMPKHADNAGTKFASLLKSHRTDVETEPDQRLQIPIDEWSIPSEQLGEAHTKGLNPELLNTELEKTESTDPFPQSDIVLITLKSEPTAVTPKHVEDTAEQSEGIASRNDIKQSAAGVTNLVGGSTVLVKDASPSIVLKHSTKLTDLSDAQIHAVPDQHSVRRERKPLPETNAQRDIDSLKLKDKLNDQNVQASPKIKSDLRSSTIAKKPSDLQSTKILNENMFIGLSQPGQTIADALNNNASWTKPLTNSSVNFGQLQKPGGAILETLRIQLNPVELGKVEIKLRLQEGQLQVEVKVETEKAYRSLSQDHDALATTLRGLGHKVDSVIVTGPQSQSTVQQGEYGEAIHHNESNEQGFRDGALNHRGQNNGEPDFELAQPHEQSESEEVNNSDRNVI